jgi:hypothetical protein
VNAEDPTSVLGEPTALVQGRLAAAWVERLDPAASDVQLLAARAHHLRRWASPRTDFPEGRAGYLRWRTAAKKRHAEELGELLAGAGYPAEAIERAQRIVRKEGLGTDPAVQTHEDALCLVFLETQLDPLAADLGDEKAVAVLAKTAAKMGPAGLAAAGGLALSPHGAALLADALRSLPSDPA